MPHPKVRVAWANPGEARATLVTTTRNGHTRERSLGPRTLLTLASAAVVLNRPVAEVRRAIDAGFLRAARPRPPVRVTLRACRAFLDEERADGVRARASLEEMRRTGAKPIPADVVHRELGLE